MQKNYMRRHIFSIPELIREEAGQTWDLTESVLFEHEWRNLEHIVITGCGYSYAAALHAKYIFEEIGGVSTEALFSVDASRHKSLNVLPPQGRTLVIGISNSGVVARIRETLLRFRQAGNCTVAFTGDEDSACARAAARMVSTAVPSLESSLPLRGFVKTLLVVYAMAWKLAVIKGKVTDRDRQEFYKELREFACRLEERMPAMEEQVKRFAGLYANCQAFEFVGSGMEYASAWLGKQMMAGQTGKLAIDCSLEDWLHSDFFLSDPRRIATCLYAPKRSRAYSRIREVRKYMIYLERPLCVVTDSDEILPELVCCVRTPKTNRYVFGAITGLCPTALLAGEVCELIGEEYSRGFRGKWDFAENGKATEFSEILTEQ